MDAFGEKNPKIMAMNARGDPNLYVRYWKVPLCKTCAEDCPFCCYAILCHCCASYTLRKQALHDDMSRYVCCNGGCPCSGHMGEEKCPSFCLCLEAFCCFAQSVASTRFMIQDELRIQTSACDNCIIGTMIVLEYIACVCHIIACITGNRDIQSLAQLIQLIADLVWCSVCACMQTQHRIEMDERDKNPGSYGPPLPPPHMMAPAVQMIPMPPPLPGAYPPPQGYPPQGYPPQGYPPQGYPPQGYPPAQGFPPQGYPAQGNPVAQGYPSQGYPQQNQMQR
ncbi:hypothetical protein CEUSTIGMA_g12147.t1 [Chlamydomonas eustigma]|uniref:Rhodopsin n=1 Tax=Chlamydomonas eustigma TaxID=1157962 RepID=A0A250XNQ6_9CHLO|nr:hypothetical protein CEUSTIGMA_g12147.t1 [Chlamydomonas eustigma]|eukprot:GAX84725.1 hypothetical protein CEUSTIGMA_g12147.t1 [Chlamydomonas eustigma]